MSANENLEDTHIYQTEREVVALGELLKEARNSDNTKQICIALIETVEGLIEQLRKQARLIEDLRSDLTHKQGIVTNIGGGDYDK